MYIGTDANDQKCDCGDDIQIYYGTPNVWSALRNVSVVGFVHLHSCSKAGLKELSALNDVDCLCDGKPYSISSLTPELCLTEKQN